MSTSSNHRFHPKKYLSLLALSALACGVGCSASPNEEVEDVDAAITVGGSCNLNYQGGYGMTVDADILLDADRTATGYRVTKIHYTTSAGGFFPHKVNFSILGVLKTRDANGDLKSRTIDFGQPKVVVHSKFQSMGSESHDIELETKPIDVPFDSMVGLKFTWERRIMPDEDCESLIYAFRDSLATTRHDENFHYRHPKVGETCKEYFAKEIAQSPESSKWLCPSDQPEVDAGAPHP